MENNQLNKTSPILSLEKINFNVRKKEILKDISFEIYPGEFVGLIGPNGAGKSTLLKIIMEIEKPSSGKINFNYKGKVGYVPQDSSPTHFSLSVLEFLELGFPRKSILRSINQKKNEIHLAIENLKKVQLDETFLEKKFSELSGGQQQRVILARSLFSNPTLLLFDEPFSGIDFKTKLNIYELLSNINREDQTTIIFVSHEIDNVIARCHKILCLNRELHQGCHPMDFIMGNQDCNASHLEKSYLEKTLSKKNQRVLPIHHHH